MHNPIIHNPRNGTEGYWTPDDQAETKMTPMRVIFKHGMWYSVAAYRDLNIPK